MAFKVLGADVPEAMLEGMKQVDTETTRPSSFLGGLFAIVGEDKRVVNALNSVVVA